MTDSWKVWTLLALAPSGTLAQTPRSPLIDSLRAESGLVGAVAWSRLAARGLPLVEPVTGDSGKRLVTFVWGGDDTTRNVVLVTPLTLLDFEGNGLLERLAGTGLWYKSLVLPSDSRFLYRFAPNDNLVPFERDPDFMQRSRTWRPDPANPKQFDYGPFGQLSVLELPDAPSDRWVGPQPGIPHGLVTKATIDSKALGRTNSVWVYTPPGYVAGRRAGYSLVVFTDGEAYQTLIPAPTILDNLQVSNTIPPTIAVFVDNPQATRGDDLDCNPRWSRFVASELVPWVEARYAVARAPGRRVIGGFSLGGLAAACAALARPDVFGNVLAQSGSFYRAPEGEPAEWVAPHVAGIARLPLTFALEIGRFERAAIPSRDPSMYTASLHLYDVLRAKGYPATLRVVSSGHEHVSWRATLGDGLTGLLRPVK